ncbi:enamine deaminase RidA [Denitratisoma sp. DHT3]|uniref:RidA family protein n=1 Tax=Denitratisoma sp. DHT3 TaxID=1981880 RepID=UPI0011988EA2|nr:RidA family protein [Denitratisoma sp. DHT3]QDX82797.1 enamine deaminase RidA [Denitratisoma sp. DHT3]
MSLQRLNPDALLSFDAVSQIVVAQGGTTVHIAGQSAYDKSFTLIGGADYRQQSLQVLRNLRTAVEAAGGTVERIVSSTVYLKNLTPEVVEQFFAALAEGLEGKPFPPHAMTLVGVAALAGPDQLVEMSAVANL